MVRFSPIFRTVIRNSSEFRWEHPLFRESACLLRYSQSEFQRSPVSSVPDWCTEAWEKDKAEREMLLTEFVPYMRLHCNLSEQERTAADMLENGENLTLEQTAYCGMEEHHHDESCYEKKLDHNRPAFRWAGTAPTVCCPDTADCRVPSCLPIWTSSRRAMPFSCACWMRCLHTRWIRS